MPDKPYSSFQLAVRYLRYYCTSDNGRGHGIHSPFVYDFVRKVLRDKKQQPAFAAIEALRARLLRDRTRLPVADWGAGSVDGHAPARRICDIAKRAAKPRRLAQLLYRSVQYFQPRSVLEMGSSLGISGAYLAAAAAPQPVTTLEGAPALAEKAAAHFRELELNNITVIHGRFFDQLPALLATTPPDFAYVDGHHTEAATLEYFHLLKTAAHPGMVMVFDDIHWSPGMESAWNAIRRDPAVTCSIDLFFLGFVFFNPDIKIPQHFSIRY